MRGEEGGVRVFEEKKKSVAVNKDLSMRTLQWKKIKIGGVNDWGNVSPQMASFKPQTDSIGSSNAAQRDGILRQERVKHSAPERTTPTNLT